MQNLDNASRVHIIGIGGIGVSAVARMLMRRGVRVSGSDMNSSPITKRLKEEGAHVYIGHRAGNIPRATELVLYTIAIPRDNPELKRARREGIPTMTYPEALGYVSRERKTIAVSGTHGKTTTTAMIARILERGGVDPTVVVGSVLRESGDNFRAGGSDVFLVEACEFQKSFLNLSPAVLVITNIDNDHLDYYKNISEIIRAFRALARKVPADGYIVTRPSDPYIARALSSARARIIDYGAERLPVRLKVPGAHNRENAKAALALGRILNVSPRAAKRALLDFKGVWRRQEYKGKTKRGALVYDDYAHHPTEIAATVAAFRERYPRKKLTVVFQPHLYSRTKFLFDDLLTALRNADALVILPIYAAREKPLRGVSSRGLARALSKEHRDTVYCEKFTEAAKQVRVRTGKNDVVLTMGAGDVYRVGEALVDS